MTDNENNDNKCLASYNNVKIVGGKGCKTELDTNLMNTKVYKKRWLMLFLFSFSSAINYMSYPQYVVITNIITRYYDVSTVTVDWTTMIYLVIYIPLVVPAGNLFVKIGLRRALILGISFTALGAWIKVFSVAPDRFYLLFIGQAIKAAMMICFISSPSSVSAQWFPSEQVSTATSLGVFGSLFGMAVGFLLPPIFVKNHDDFESIGKDLQVLNYLYAGLATIAALLVIFFFKQEPKLPPSAARALLKVNRIESKESFIEPLRRLSKNKCFLLLFNVYGLNVGVYNSVAALLSQIYVIHFPNGEEEAGQIGLLLVLAGLPGAFCFGLILDKTRKYKALAVTDYFLCLLAQIMFALAISIEVKWVIYASAIFLGFSLTGYFSLAYELCVEYTYPESEFITAGILIISSNLYGIVLVLILGHLMELYGDVAAHIGFCCALFIGFMITIFIKDEQRRESVRKATSYKTVPTKDNDVNLTQLA